ncbi:hypothetical protein BAE44_0023498 [Dichanthelium oligosanthes]|uniref:MBD domain-containing protein n=1 Tax=Dichanthelium oligosanthes TaxID=888268 RepID=A0A1E5URJ9_9POAL|nr:hypothetical protein BAE44_0023498 [Dichanthelium oligosanthes]
MGRAPVRTCRRRSYLPPLPEAMWKRCAEILMWPRKLKNSAEPKGGNSDAMVVLIADLIGRAGGGGGNKDVDKVLPALQVPGYQNNDASRQEKISEHAIVLLGSNTPTRYYTSPSGKKLRSLVEIGRYLAENPHYIREGVNLSQFSFATPKPLQEDYVRKRAIGGAHDLPELPEVAQVEHSTNQDIGKDLIVDPLCWAAPPTRRELLTGPGSTSDPADINQPEMSNHVDLHQPEVSGPPAQYSKNKKRTVKQVSSRKCQRTLPAASCPFKEQSGGHSIDIDHVAL